VTIPDLPDLDYLADECVEIAARERVQPGAVAESVTASSNRRRFTFLAAFRDHHRWLADLADERNIRDGH
jgi:hypothetical protein